MTIDEVHAFHVVIPSMSGYGFSGKPTSTGWGPARMGRAWAGRMKRLGYTYHRVDKGGHFAAWEQPQLFSEEVRAAFRSLR